MNFILGLLFGYLFGWFICGSKECEPVEIRISQTKIHIHHWMFFLVLLIIYSRFYNIYTFIPGFLLGGIIHGFTYNDWYKIIV